VQDIVIGWFIVPGFVGSVVAGIWNHLARQEIRRLESRLRKQEETYKSAQSPRVLATIELSNSVCEYERSMGAIVNPFKVIMVPPEKRGVGWDTLGEEHARGLRVAEREAWAALRVARNKAELLLPPSLLETFDGFFDEYAEAHEQQQWMNFPGLTDDSKRETVDKRDQHLVAASKLRRSTLAALQSLLGTEHVLEQSTGSALVR
jgi:hypothetical protein